jgi:hypothetical protein
MLLRITFSLGLVQICAMPLAAQTADQLSQLLRIDDVMRVMHDEGLSHGADLQAELFPGAGGERWQRLVADIYDPDAMLRRFEAVFGPEMAADPESLEATLTFFASERGRRIIDLELAARRALLDEAVEEVARAQVEEMRRADDPRIDVIQRFAEVNDLVEQNVAGALNSNLAFYRGMVSGGAFEGGLSEGEILADVWSQEAEVRLEAQEWLFPFLTLAYQPLSDDDLDAYLAFSETAPGQVLNSALFAGFDAVFETISQDLGLAAAQMLSSQDL